MRFWGVRGSIACPGPDTVRYGGNTSCVEIRCGDRLMIFDGGTGLRLLGNELMGAGRPAELDLFYSHTHFDHICGLPFFAPCYDARSHIRIWAGHLNGIGIEARAEQHDDRAAVSDPDGHLYRQARFRRFPCRQDAERRIAGFA